MNKFAIISLVLIFVVLIILKVNFFWLAVLAVAAAYFVRKHLQKINQDQDYEEVLKESKKLEEPSHKLTSKEEKVEWNKIDREIGYESSDSSPSSPNKTI